MPDFRCPNCQTDLGSTAQFCRRCGFKVSAPLVSPSATEATTRNLPNPPQMTDFRQTNNFSSSPFGPGQPQSGNFPPQMGQQMPYMAVPVPPRRSNGPKILLISFLAFAFMAFCMVLVLVRPFNRHPRPVPISRPLIPVSGTSYVKTFKLPANGKMSLSTVNGKIDVTTYDGDSIEFKAVKDDGSSVSMDEALVMSLNDTSFSAQVRGGRNASVNYEVKIPRKLGEISLTSVNGSINIEGLEAKIKANCTNGEISLKDIAGSVDLNTVNGDQSVSFKNPPTGDLKFNATHGDISMKFSTEPDMRVSVDTMTGDIESDYPLDKKSRPASNTAKGTLGKGIYNLIAHNMSGDITISR